MCWTHPRSHERVEPTVDPSKSRCRTVSPALPYITPWTGANRARPTRFTKRPSSSLIPKFCAREHSRTALRAASPRRRFISSGRSSYELMGARHDDKTPWALSRLDLGNFLICLQIHDRYIIG